MRSVRHLHGAHPFVMDRLWSPASAGPFCVGGRLAKKMPRRSGAVARRCPSRCHPLPGFIGGILCQIRSAWQRTVQPQITHEGRPRRRPHAAL